MYKTLKDVIFWNAFQDEISNIQKKIMRMLKERLSSLEREIAHTPDIETTMELKQKYIELEKFYNSIHDGDFLLNLSIDELEEKTGYQGILFELFSK